jgi:hypothetical protein
VPGLNLTHGLGLSGVVACHAWPVKRLLGLGLAAQSGRRAALVLRARQARCGVVTARGMRGGVLVGGPVVASRQQGHGLEHYG